MRALIQRVSQASVRIEGQVHGQIKVGLLVLIGVAETDDQTDVQWLVRKIINMRIFSDQDDKMNLSVKDIDGGVLVVSQFTLHASTKKGNRPSFISAANPTKAIPLYEAFVYYLGQELEEVATGLFGADMKISLINDGPVTIWLDTENKE